MGNITGTANLVEKRDSLTAEAATHRPGFQIYTEEHIYSSTIVTFSLATVEGFYDERDGIYKLRWEHEPRCAAYVRFECLDPKSKYYGYIINARITDRKCNCNLSMTAEFLGEQSVINNNLRRPKITVDWDLYNKSVPDVTMPDGFLPSTDWSPSRTVINWFDQDPPQEVIPVYDRVKAVGSVTPPGENADKLERRGPQTKIIRKKTIITR